MFNALKYIKKLEAVGFPREQAEVQVQLVLDSIEQEVATKADISAVRSDMAELRSELKTEMAELRADMAELRTELKAEMAELRTELKTGMAELRAEVKSDIAEIRTELAAFKVDIVFKLGATMIGSMTVATAILGFLIKS